MERDVLIRELTAELVLRGGYKHGPDDEDLAECHARDVLAAVERLGYTIVRPNDEERYTSPDMFEAWTAGARWVVDRVEIVDGELDVPEDQPGCEGLDWGEACGFWLGEFDMEREGAADG